MGKTQSGFGYRTTAQQVTQGIDASNLTVLITGATSGIGTETARVLALRGAHVHITGRSLQSTTATKEEILKKVPDAKVDILAPFDLNSQASIRKSTESFLSLGQPLNVLINNAGIMLAPYELTEDGIESHFGTNHIGHFLLTNQLLNKLKETANATGIESRIVIVSSRAITTCPKEGVKWENYNDEKGYNAISAYSLSKIANHYHAQELTRRFKEEGVTNVTENTLHPGIIKTNLMRHIHGFFRASVVVMYYATSFIWKDVPQATATTCYAALHPQLKGVSGKFFNDCNEFDPTKWCPFAHDAEAARKLWDVSLKLTSK
ncbi:unnamed protein product [Calypogeia fissa]